LGDGLHGLDGLDGLGVLGWGLGLLDLHLRSNGQLHQRGY
jgi:hypothetical protein